VFGRRSNDPSSSVGAIVILFLFLGGQDE